MATDIAAPVAIEEPCITEPRVMLRWSDDGGHSWSHERRVAMGKVGEFETRVIFRRLGSSRDRVYELKVTDAVNVRFISAFIDTEAGSS